MNLRWHRRWEMKPAFATVTASVILPVAHKDTKPFSRYGMQTPHSMTFGQGFQATAFLLSGKAVIVEISMIIIDSGVVTGESNKYELWLFFFCANILYKQLT